MSNPVTPLGYRVLIRSDIVEQTTESGIVLASADEQKRRQGGQMWGTLLAMGETAFTGPDWEGARDNIKVGDKVLFGRYSGMTFDKAGTVEGGSTAIYRVCSDTDIMGVVNEDIKSVEE